MRRALAGTLLIVAAGALLSACAGGIGTGRIYRVPSGSMEPTLQIGEHVAVAPLDGTPEVGDVVVFHVPRGAASRRCGGPPARGQMCSLPVSAESGVLFVRRIVAGPGDEIYLKGGHLYRRAAGSSGFVREPDSHIRGCAAHAPLPCTYPRPITIAAGHWFMLGDNRGESDDSRFWGPVPTSWIQGTVQL